MDSQQGSCRQEETADGEGRSAVRLEWTIDGTVIGWRGLSTGGAAPPCRQVGYQGIGLWQEETVDEGAAAPCRPPFGDAERDEVDAERPATFILLAEPALTSPEDLRASRLLLSSETGSAGAATFPRLLGDTSPHRYSSRPSSSRPRVPQCNGQNTTA